MKSKFFFFYTFNYVLAALLRLNFKVLKVLEIAVTLTNRYSFLFVCLMVSRVESILSIKSI